MDNSVKVHDSKDKWLRLAKDAYDSSTTYVNANYRQKWEDALKAFQGIHAADSKYWSDAYKYRSKLYRPKLRAAERKNEAAAAAAYFSNMDVLNTQALNQGDPKQVASASVMKAILEYRLDKSIPWFQTLMGAVQDAQTVGVVCSYQYWKYKEKRTKTPHPLAGMLDENGQAVPDHQESIEVLEDRPCIDLVPVENIRIDPAASWIDPVNTSPYFIHMIPMYVIDVRSMMKQVNPKTGESKWKQLDESELLTGVRNSYDPTRYARNDNREDPTETAKPVTEYSIAWIHRNFIRQDDVDYVYYTLGTNSLLTDPKPIKEVYLHGVRPYTMGCCVLETHKVYPSGTMDLGRDLQKEANEIVNQRLDNVKLVLNKRWLIKRGAQVDINALMRNVPGGGIVVNDTETDVKEVNFPDVTGSSYQEQNLINLDIDDLLGNFSTGSVQSNRKLHETARGMAMVSQSANQLTEYLLRTITETWVKPTLTQLVKLEQKYETDEVVMAIAADKAKLLQRFGMDKVTDELLNHDLTIMVNVGIGATDPNAKLQKLIAGVQAYAEISQQPPANLNLMEVGKEIFGFMGYQDGQRFLSGEDPRIKQMQQQIQQLTQELQSNQQDNQTTLQVEGMKQETANRKIDVEHEGMLRKHIQHQDTSHIKLLTAKIQKAKQNGKKRESRTDG